MKHDKKWRIAVHGLGVVSLLILDRDLNIPQINEYCDQLFMSEFAQKSNYLQDLQLKFEQRFTDVSDDDLIFLALGLINVVGDFSGIKNALRSRLKQPKQNILNEYLAFMRHNYVTNLKEYNNEKTT